MNAAETLCTDGAKQEHRQGRQVQEAAIANLAEGNIRCRQRPTQDHAYRSGKGRNATGAAAANSTQA